MIPQRIPIPEDGHQAFCTWVGKWGLDMDLATRLRRMQEGFPVTLKIISGQRTPEQQDALRDAGRPTAPNHLSTHLSCPLSTGADLTPSTGIDNGVILQFGQAATSAGLRWGGGSPVDPDTGIPSDWNHVDTGPRAAL